MNVKPEIEKSIEIIKEILESEYKINLEVGEEDLFKGVVGCMKPPMDGSNNYQIMMNTDPSTESAKEIEMKQKYVEKLKERLTEVNENKAELKKEMDEFSERVTDSIEDQNELKGYLRNLDGLQEYQEQIEQEIEKFEKSGDIDKSMDEKDDNDTKKDSINLFEIAYPGMSIELIEDHVMIHELAHVFDWVNKVTTDYDGQLHENGCEFFAEYLSWMIVLGDLDRAYELARNYSICRSPNFTEQSRKSIQCACEVIYYRHMEEFKQVSELLNKDYYAIG